MSQTVSATNWRLCAPGRTKPCLWLLLLQLVASPVLARQANGSSRNATSQVPSIVARTPDAVVRGLYREVVAHHPIGIPDGMEMKIFAPYLSKALLHKIDLAVGCSADEARQHPDPNLKPEIGWLELGLFSGGDEKASPRAFRIERTEAQEDGSFRVYVRLVWGRQKRPWIWHVAANVVREEGHFVVEDVIYLEDLSAQQDEWRLSAALTYGCDGSRWVGRSPESEEKRDCDCADYLRESQMSRQVEHVEMEADLIGDHVNIKGTALVEVTLDDAGRVICAQALSGHPIAIAHLMEASRRWRFKPYLKNGNAQPFCGRLRLNFSFVENKPFVEVAGN